MSEPRLNHLGLVVASIADCAEGFTRAIRGGFIICATRSIVWTSNGIKSFRDRTVRLGFFGEEYKCPWAAVSGKTAIQFIDFSMGSRAGLEPAILSLKVTCSTI